MADPTTVQHAPDLVWTIGTYVQTWAPAAAAPIMAWLYSVVKKMNAVAENLDALVIQMSTNNRLLEAANIERQKQTTAIVNK